MTVAHNILFKPSETSDTVIDVVCTCGAKLRARNSTDAMQIAHTHVVSEYGKIDKDCLCWYAIKDFDGIHHDRRCDKAKELSEEA